MPSKKATRREKEAKGRVIPMLRAPIASGSDVMLHVGSAIQEVRTLPIPGKPEGFKLFLPPTLNIENYAVSSAIVVSAGERNDMGIRPGDEVAVSYFLAADHTYAPGASKPTFNRCIFVGENQSQNRWLWRASKDMIMGVKRDGRWQGLGGFVFMKEIWQRANVNTSLVLPAYLENQLLKGFGSYVGGDLYFPGSNEPLNIPAGTALMFKEAHRSVYDFEDGGKFIVLPYSLIAAFLYKLDKDKKPLMQAINDNILVEPIEDTADLQTVVTKGDTGIEIKNKVTSGGVFIPDAVKDMPVRGTVVSVGQGSKCQRNGNESVHLCQAMSVKVGDIIMYRKNAGYEVPYDGKAMRMMKEMDVLAIV